MFEAWAADSTHTCAGYLPEHLRAAALHRQLAAGLAVMESALAAGDAIAGPTKAAQLRLPLTVPLQLMVAV